VRAPTTPGLKPPFASPTLRSRNMFPADPTCYRAAILRGAPRRHPFGRSPSRHPRASLWARDHPCVGGYAAIPPRTRGFSYNAGSIRRDSRTQPGGCAKQPNVDDRVDALRLFSYKDHERAPGGDPLAPPAPRGRRWARSSRQALMAPIKLRLARAPSTSVYTASSVSRRHRETSRSRRTSMLAPLPCGKSDDPAQEPERRHAPRRLCPRTMSPRFHANVNRV